MLMMSIPVNMSGCLGLCRLLPGSLDGTCPLVTIMMMVMVVVMLMMVMLAVMIVVMITMKLRLMRCIPTIQGTYTSFSCRPDMKASLNMKMFIFRSFWSLPDVKATDDMNIWSFQNWWTFRIFSVSRKRRKKTLEMLSLKKDFSKYLGVAKPGPQPPHLLIFSLQTPHSWMTFDFSINYRCIYPIHFSLVILMHLSSLIQSVFSLIFTQCSYCLCLWQRHPTETRWDICSSNKCNETTGEILDRLKQDSTWTHGLLRWIPCNGKSKSKVHFHRLAINRTSRL